jgi:hypothetical protein
MADSLVLTGVKDVKKHTGTEMLLTRPKRGGDTHSVKEWWKGGGVSTCYAECTVFDVTTADGTVKLVLDSNGSTNIRIDHDGSFNFTFIGINEVSRGALFTDGYELIEHYVFPRISGGKVMTVTPAGSADRPSAAPAPPTGVVTGASISAAGTGYTSGQNGVSVTGGSGSGMTINFGSDGDEINSVSVVSGGQDYVNGETVNVPGGNDDGELIVVV